MSAEPRRHGSSRFVLDCDDSSCDVCTLGPLPGEDRASWQARLKARFAAAPVPDLPVGRRARHWRGWAS